MPDGDWKSSHLREEYVSETGVIGYRGGDSSGCTWYNHMAAKKIRDLIGENIWNEYFRFTVIRNPFDKLISAFYMYEKRKQHGRLSKESLINRARCENEIERFRRWVKSGGKVIDRQIYMIDGEVCVDYFIPFEDLAEGIKCICNRLTIPFEPSRIQRLKAGARPGSVPICEYYDSETEQIVREIYAWEISKFGYDLPAESMSQPVI